MPINYPKFDRKISGLIEDSKFVGVKNRPGTIMEYNSARNTATIVVDEKFSNTIRKYTIECPMSICLWSANCCSSTWY